jgi:aminopeptidase-like protein
MPPEEIQNIQHYMERLWPIMRSITGEGVRETHRILSELVPLTMLEIPSGQAVYDWVIPNEWVFRQATLIGPNGQVICDARDNNLHVVNYSIPFQGTVSKQELDEHLYSLPAQPEAIPYVTSYYQPKWGFCLSHQVREALPDGNYQVVIDTELRPGSLTLSECILPGETDQEVLISTDTCHPSLGNNELSGPLVAAFLYGRLAALPNRRLTYRFVFLPETIGSITFLALRGQHLIEKLIAGYTVTCAGDRGPFTYKASRQGKALCDKAALQVLNASGAAFQRIDFTPAAGSDERQYCSPGFNLPVGSLMRTRYATYPEYHTSLDNLDFISAETIQESVEMYFQVCSAIDGNRSYLNLFPFGEPKLDRRGLYSNLGITQERLQFCKAIMWVLNYSDGTHDLLDIATKSKLPFATIQQAATACEQEGLLQEVSTGQSIMRPNTTSDLTFNTVSSHNYANV